MDSRVLILEVCGVLNHVRCTAGKLRCLESKSAFFAFLDEGGFVVVYRERKDENSDSRRRGQERVVQHTDSNAQFKSHASLTYSGILGSTSFTALNTSAYHSYIPFAPQTASLHSWIPIHPSSSPLLTFPATKSIHLVASSRYRPSSHISARRLDVPACSCPFAPPGNPWKSIRLPMPRACSRAHSAVKMRQAFSYTAATSAKEVRSVNWAPRVKWPIGMRTAVQCAEAARYSMSRSVSADRQWASHLAHVGGRPWKLIELGWGVRF